MPTPLFDQLCIELVQRIPTEFKTVFTAGSGALPDSYVLPKENIIDYINRSLNKLFNQYWTAVKGNLEMFIKIFPELNKYSAELTLINGNYPVITPHLDFYRAISGKTSSGSKFIKQWDTTKYNIALTGKYDEYVATLDNPALIQVKRLIAFFPQSLGTAKVYIQYIAMPISPTTGNYLTQNHATEDSPFLQHWNSQIVDLAYQMYLEESYETS
jgi:hypothetical protein